MSESTEFTKDLATKRVSRRTFLMGVAGSAALGVVGFGIGGCSSSPAPAASTGSGAAGGGAKYAGRTLRLMLNGGRLEDVVREAVIQSFEKKTGATVETVPANSAEMLTRARAEKASPTVDVMIIDDMVAVQGIAEGLFEKVDPANVPNMKDLDKKAIDSNGYGPIIHSNIINFGYNKDLVKVDPPQSWADLWDPKYKEMLAISAINLTTGVQFLLQAAMLNGGSYEKIDPGFQALQKIKPNIRKWIKDIGDVRPTVDKEPVFAVFGPNVWMDERSKGFPLAWSNPKEGAHGLPATGQIVKGSKNKDLAEVFLNEYLSVEGQTGVSKGTYFKVFNDKVKLPADVQEVIPQAVQVFDPAKIAKYREEWTARWLKEIGG
ncbi:MAG: polyamine ABC transporter substrate-binding protein [Chloroflexi bacterium]|nr:polyamine ABC transporter substrate-binding protein [Chloroflexota bacterium]